MQSTRAAPKLTEAMLSRFDALTSPNGDCIIWTASKNRGGYGQFFAGKTEDGRRSIVLSHRFAWVRANGSIPNGMCVCHKCDVRLCVNPDHLFLRTHADNNRDMFSKCRGHVLDGSHILGERHTQAKLTAEAVREIRSLEGRGLSLRQIGERFGVTAANVHMIIRRRAWTHVA